MITNDKLAQVYLINDRPTPVTVKLTLEVHAIDAVAPSAPSKGQQLLLDAPPNSDSSSCSAALEAGTAPLVASSTAVNVTGAAAVLAAKQDVDSLLALVTGCTRTTCFVRATAAAAATAAPGAAAAAAAAVEATVWLAPFKQLQQLQDPRIEFSRFEQHPESPGTVKFAVTSASVAVAAVWEAPGLAGRFSVNAVALVPCRPLEVLFISGGGGGEGGLVQQLQEELRVTSLWDHQQF